MTQRHQLNRRPLPPKFGNDSRLDSHKEVEQFSQSDDRGPGGNRACLGGRRTSDITHPAATGVKASPPSPDTSRQTAEQVVPKGATAPKFPSTPAVGERGTR